MKKTFALLATLALLFAAGALSAAAPLQEWDFSKATDFLGWTTAEPLDSFAVRDGLLKLSPGPGAAKLESPPFDIAVDPRQTIEIEISSDSSGWMPIYYSSNVDPPYHGFRAEQYVRVWINGDGQLHTYTVRPFWLSQPKITHIRFDPPGKNIAVRSVRILGTAGAAGIKQAHWDFRGSDAGWQPLTADATSTPTDAGLSIEGSLDATVLSPMLDVAAAEHPRVTIRASSQREGIALFRWLGTGANSMRSCPVMLQGDGRVHSYALDLTDNGAWKGTIKAIGITPSQSNAKERLVVESVSLTDKPTGPAEVDIIQLFASPAFVRQGQNVTISAEVVNLGGEAAPGLTSQLFVDDGSGSELLPAKVLPPINGGASTTINWTYTAPKAGPLDAVCRVFGRGQQYAVRTLNVPINEALPKSATQGLSYVPAPKPADTGDCMVGCYYFPGWAEYTRWSVLNDYPERHPVLGYYREGDPEVADWQVTWALDHGISFFIYDWYWSAGKRQLDHAIHQGLFKSRYGNQMKFCLLWANHNPPNTHSQKDLEDVTKYWIDNYFSKPNYLKLNGKNVVVIFSTWNLTSDLGADGVRTGFQKMRKMCEDAGVGGLYIVGCASAYEYRVRDLMKEGYDALSGYNYPDAGTTVQQFAPYSWMVNAYKDNWNDIASWSSVPYIPICEAGWDARPWHGANSNVRTGKTPQLWQKMLSNAKQFVDDPAHSRLAGQKLVFLEAWNEFGEGDYIEPHAQYGFDYLEAIRKVYAPNSQKPTIVVPGDIGLGPYDVSPLGPKTSWNFGLPADREWTAGNQKDLSYDGGAMSATSEGTDPIFYSPSVKINASKFKLIEISMKTDADGPGEVFFIRPNTGWSQDQSVEFDVTGDNRFHTYVINMSANPLWKRSVQYLRIDPNSKPGSRTSIQNVRFRER